MLLNEYIVLILKLFMLFDRNFIEFGRWLLLKWLKLFWWIVQLLFYVEMLQIDISLFVMLSWLLNDSVFQLFCRLIYVCCLNLVLLKLSCLLLRWKLFLSVNMVFRLLFRFLVFLRLKWFLYVMLLLNLIMCELFVLFMQVILVLRILYSVMLFCVCLMVGIQVVYVSVVVMVIFVCFIVDYFF